jgi:aminoacyl tRNA synthase complex-interacting multifunctional protein 1
MPILPRLLFRTLKAYPRPIHHTLRAMATATVPEQIQSILKRSFPDATVDPAADASKISSSLFPEAKYSDAEKAEIDQWVITSTHIASANEDAAKAAERLSSLNTHLSSRTTVLGSKPSVADIALFARLAPAVQKWSADERTGEQGYHHIVRHIDFVQNAPVFQLKLEEGEKVAINPDEVKVPIKPVDAKAEKERKKREKEAASAAASASASGAATPNEAAAEGKKSKKDKAKDALENATAAVAGGNGKAKKEKKEKQPKPQKPAVVEKPLSPSLIDLRVGHILKAVQHPNADSLYVSTIAVGDAPGTDNTIEYEGQVCRTVCSGLNGLVPLEEMQNRKIVAVCNLKPVTMRGIKSAAMVLAASPRDEGGNGHRGPVELVNPPEGAKAGERIYFEGWEGEPEAVLNPKKKVWEMIQPGFTTTEDLGVGFEVAAVPQLVESGKLGVAALRTKEGLCSVKTLKGATVR